MGGEWKAVSFWIVMAMLKLSEAGQKQLGEARETTMHRSQYSNVCVCTNNQITPLK